MKTFIKQDSWIVAELTKLSDIVGINLLFVLTSVPVITAGASASAAYYSLMRLGGDRLTQTAQTYFDSFRSCFRKSTAAWLIVLAALVSVICDISLARYFLSGTAASAVYCFAAAVLLAVTAVASWLFPLIALYENTLKEHIRNSLRLCISFFPRTMLLVVIKLIPLVYFICYPGMIAFLWVVWLLAGFSVVMKLSCMVIRPAFARLGYEEDQEKKETDHL